MYTSQSETDSVRGDSPQYCSYVVLYATASSWTQPGLQYAVLAGAGRPEARGWRRAQGMDRSASARLPKAPRWCLARLTAPLHTSLILPVWPIILPSYPSYPSHPSYPSYPSSHHLATAPPRLQTLEDKAYEVRQRRYQANLNAVELFDTAIARQREWLEAESTEVEQDWAGAELLAREARDRAAAASKLVRSEVSSSR